MPYTYININSNPNPRSIIKQISNKVNWRRNRLSSKIFFECNKEPYNEAQHNNGFNQELNETNTYENKSTPYNYRIG